MLDKKESLDYLVCLELKVKKVKMDIMVKTVYQEKKGYQAPLVLGDEKADLVHLVP